MHGVCRWIGNSEPVAAKHDLQMTDEHFERAVVGLLGSQDVKAATMLPGRRRSCTKTEERAGKRKTPKARKDLTLRKIRPISSQNLVFARFTQYPLGDSNPCSRTENPMSWASRRRGQDASAIGTANQAINPCTNWRRQCQSAAMARKGQRRDDPYRRPLSASRHAGQVDQSAPHNDRLCNLPTSQASPPFNQEPASATATGADPHP